MGILKKTKDLTRHIKVVLRNLKDNKFYSNGKKNQFEPLEMEFLRYVVTSDGIKPDMKKIKVIRR